MAIAIHDVSPATWRECRELLAMLDNAGAGPVTLLVIPRHHHRTSVLREHAFVRAMDARLARGDELVLHGYFHIDDAPAPRTLRQWFARRVLTRTEGEFAAIDAEAAASRIARGVALFDRLGWPLAGFAPPAWLLGDGARSALSHCAHAFEYVTVRSGIYHLPAWRFERTANLCYSPDSALRRAVSRAAIGHELRRANALPLLRISLHPQDVRGAGVLRHWQRLIADALAGRTPVTKCQWVRLFRAPEAPPGCRTGPRFVSGDDAARASPAHAAS
ncbi:MAG TPA: polysaccharide deacetylase family protein [Casimicrobiaceae bacterium]|nr:polysaccharide deacetylase family protein [Casimicrobiaceae bacterium]